ncbi:flagellar filament capping protein FliD [Pseudomonas sp. A-1]|jgi:flagellar hook-associated protein 2|uniref:flagellar filament capping protein FliD n=1 Tax=unclassified Pseudomonas TaxID=196821 RepID=UPI0010A6A907|nr:MULTISPECIES: flagellar filament capping protein FliD [unclassified Pseudomonas]THG74618.1 flagellar filament capping protein FliD [Pseudomonas sp. A-1]WPP46859.1 flagellar filament capping protein FliD [Pseudomonas sp. AN-1]
MASISSLGVGSGLDLSGLLDQLDSAERLKLQPVTKQKKAQQAKLSAYGRLESALTKVQDAAKKLGDSKTFQAVTSSITGTGVTAAAKSDAVAGRYEVAVTNLAQAQSLASVGLADRTTDLGAGTLTITQGSGATQKTLTVTLDANASSLEDLRDAINKQNGGVSASIVNDGSATPHRLVLTAKDTGTDARMTVTGDYGGVLNLSEKVEARNAALKVNGIDIASQSNMVEGAVQGVSLSLSEAGGSHVLTVARDSAAIKSAVTGFVDAWNSLQGTVSSLTAYNADTQVAGDLLGDATLRGVHSQLRNVLTASLGEGALTRLADVGIELELKGTLKLDGSKLDGLISGDLMSVSGFFAGVGTADGLADKLSSTLETVLKDGGALDTVSKGVEGRIKSLDERYARMEESISATVERYRKQFTQLDLMLSEMNATTSYLTQQFDALNAQLNG